MPKTALITDFDNTLYDWFHMWHQSFTAMLGEIKRISGLGDDVLLAEIRKVHQQFGTSEYAFLVEALPSLHKAFPEKNLAVVFDDAIHAYRRARKANLRLYEGVRETLAELRSANVLIALYTDSLAFYTLDRIQRLGLDELVDFVYSPPDHEIPNSVTSHAQREKYRLIHAQHRHLPEGIRKPNPEALLDIVRDIGRSSDECFYLGDSKQNDIGMAQDAGVTDIFASYGGVQHHEEYELLRKVSHWPETQVQSEKVISCEPTFSISNFSDIKKFFGV